MANILKKRSAAVVITVLVCAVSLLAGVHLSVGRQAKKIENAFETGVYYDGYLHPAISDQLDDRQNAALGIITIASGYEELSAPTDGLRSARQQLLDAEDGTLYDKYAANEKLEAAYEKLMTAMDGVSLSDDNAAAMESYSATMEAAQNLISTSGYNLAVSEFNRDILGSFPVSILRYPAFVDAPEFFGAEG